MSVYRLHLSLITSSNSPSNKERTLHMPRSVPTYVLTKCISLNALIYLHDLCMLNASNIFTLISITCT